MNEQLNDDEQIREYRRQRIEKMQREKELQMQHRRYLKKLLPIAGGVVLILLLIVVGTKVFGNLTVKDQNAVEKMESLESAGNTAVNTINDDDVINVKDSNDSNIKASSGQEVNSQETGVVYTAQLTDQTKRLGDEIVSNYAMLIDLESGDILAQKEAMTVINPASMTKILTVLVAAEHIEEKDLDDTFTMTLEITDYGYIHDCSSVGFLADEVITVRDLFYGTILKSGADAAVGLATYVAGSQEDFVEMMNDKLEELGLSKTAHFTNCVGIYDEDHHCTIYDMAMILEAAMDNEICRKVLSERTYTTSETEQHPEGITISNWFLRRIEDKDTGGEVLYAKTGYVKESGNCAASYAEDENGKGYVCVTAGANHHWKCIYDHVDIYKQFLG